MMLGGVICGYCASGRLPAATNPDKKMMIDSTAAKIGRRIKKCENILVLREGSFYWSHTTYPTYKTHQAPVFFLPEALGGFGGSCTVASTSLFAFTRCMPLTITRSLAARPFLITRS